ncbi:MAG: 7-cyano-7-deazaguanine synthase [Desulfamplus sp.]|nr:7-cyano-7-deazaguanine synthase [Desulfamplus sp.]
MGEVLVVLSGGQDSTTCLFWALKNYNKVQTITFDYGQRHRIELEIAKKNAELAGVPNQILPINTFNILGGSALTDSINVKSELEDNHLPNTFVSGRNLIGYSYFDVDLI